jgi:hypothetical protein
MPHVWRKGFNGSIDMLQPATVVLGGGAIESPAVRAPVASTPANAAVANLRRCPNMEPSPAETYLCFLFI